jgi:hypothetical protein
VVVSIFSTTRSFATPQAPAQETFKASNSLYTIDCALTLSINRIPEFLISSFQPLSAVLPQTFVPAVVPDLLSISLSRSSSLPLPFAMSRSLELARIEELSWLLVDLARARGVDLGGPPSPCLPRSTSPHRSAPGGADFNSSWWDPPQDDRSPPVPTQIDYSASARTNYFAPPQTNYRSPPRSLYCAFCSERDHTIRRCPIAAQYFRERRVIRNGHGKYLFPDGRYISPSSSMRDQVDKYWASRDVPSAQDQHYPQSSIAPMISPPRPMVWDDKHELPTVFLNIWKYAEDETCYSEPVAHEVAAKIESAVPLPPNSIYESLSNITSHEEASREVPHPIERSPVPSVVHQVDSYWTNEDSCESIRDFRDFHDPRDSFVADPLGERPPSPAPPSTRGESPPTSSSPTPPPTCNESSPTTSSQLPPLQHQTPNIFAQGLRPRLPHQRSLLYFVSATPSTPIEDVEPPSEPVDVVPALEPLEELRDFRQPAKDVASSQMFEESPMEEDPLDRGFSEFNQEHELELQSEPAMSAHPHESSRIENCDVPIATSPILRCCVFRESDTSPKFVFAPFFIFVVADFGHFHVMSSRLFTPHSYSFFFATRRLSACISLKPLPPLSKGFSSTHRLHTVPVSPLRMSPRIFSILDTHLVSTASVSPREQDQHVVWPVLRDVTWTL